MPSVQVKFSSKLLEYTDGISRIQVQASTLPSLMNDLCDRFSSLRSALFLPAGSLRPFCRVFHNSTDVSDALLENLKLSDSDEIYFLLALSGG